METPKMQKKKLPLEIDATELNAAQIRQIKTLLSIVTHVLQTDDEGEYFDGGAEMMRLCASLIKQANFPEVHATNPKIAYDQQSIEFAMDIIQDQISSDKVVSYDN